MLAFTRADQELVHDIYREYADAIGRSIVRWEQAEWQSFGRQPGGGSSGRPEVHVALYSHAFGVDVSVFTSDAEARQCLQAVARDQCVRDPKIRRAVARRFGWTKWTDALFEALSDVERDQLVDAWSDVAPREALWISRCALEREFARRAFQSAVENEDPASDVKCPCTSS